MNLVSVAQAVLEKSNSVTIPARRPELWTVFRSNGVKVSDDGAKVLGVNGAGAGTFENLVTSLKTSFPVVTVTIKRLLAEHAINV